MKLKNNSKNAMMHKYGKDYLILEVGQVLDVPKAVADIWLKYKGIEVYITPEDMEKEKQKAIAEAVKKELEKQKKVTKSKQTKKKEQK